REFTYASTHLLGPQMIRVGWTEGVAEEVGRKTHRRFRDVGRGATPPRRSLALDLDLLDQLLGLGGLRQGDGEHALLEGRRDLVRVDGVGNPQGALVGAIAALPEMIILLLLFLRLFLLALDRQYAVGHLDLDVLLIDPRQVGVDFIGVVFFNEIHRRNGDPGLGRQERLDAERRPSERQPERTQDEVLEQPVDLAPKILERTPHLHLRRGQRRFGFAFSRDRNLCLSFCHGILHPWLLFSLSPLKDTPWRASCIDAPQTLAGDERRRPLEDASTLRLPVINARDRSGVCPYARTVSWPARA